VPNLSTNVGRLREAIDRLEPDLVHGESAVGTMAGVKSGRPTVHTIHGVIHKEVRCSANLTGYLALQLESWLAKKAVRGATQVIATSNYAAREYASQTRAPVHHIFNPIEDRFFDLENHEIDNKMLYAGLMSVRKNVLGLVRAFGVLHQRDARPELFICGKIAQPNYNAQVEQYVKTHGLTECIHLLGFVSQEEVGRHFAEAAVICLFSSEETAPMILAQAMCAGKAVVASAAGGSPDIVIDGETGFIVGCDDDHAFADRSLQLLSDPELRRRMGRRAREVAEQRFRKEVVAAQTKAVYAQALSGK
jgi:glycosyltransferase involved in cell wall biosynthesis